MGFTTGVDLPDLVQVGQWITAKLHRSNESRAGRAYAARAELRIKNERASER